MKYNVLSIPPFNKQLKRLTKKYPSLKTEYAALIEKLEENPEQGTPLGNHCFKIRLAITSKGRGKSGGARVVTHIYIEKETVFLLAIYDKSEQTDISDKELNILLLEIENQS
ncbi:MAG: type II toxin-antitoxin system RelE/ParE family toxin [Tannerella sp.]|jgi:mRNA-degrading endonuclease RelE of RelBE toxin-antitoxin system|nr:type II toxin-antitoxin system RelE/ParE family toxin [Tannerella sp.]